MNNKIKTKIEVTALQYAIMREWFFTHGNIQRFCRVNEVMFKYIKEHLNTLNVTCETGWLGFKDAWEAMPDEDRLYGLIIRKVDYDMMHIALSCMQFIDYVNQKEETTDE